ncbi:TPA: phage protease [Pseudomonas aeruginosa]|nr:phage protease [Pseudomonas aeruginosa]
MKTKRLPLAVALAACSYSLGSVAADNTIWLQVTPAGHFTPSDGREMKVPSWYIDGAVAEKVIARFSARRNKRVLDYEHQTLLKERNGQPAPAAGWIQELAWREGQGLFAKAELTTRAAGYVEAKEYLYFSPVFLYHPTSGEVLDVQMGALTNDPAIDNMEELSLRAAASFGIDLETEEENPVNPLLLAVCAALGLAANTTEEQAVAALSAFNSNLRKLLDQDDKANSEAVLAACTGLKAKAASSADPSLFVPVSVVQGLQADIAALTARLGERDEKDLDGLIGAALEDGRLHKSMEGWARGLGKENRASLTAYLDQAKPIASLLRSQTEGNEPEPDEKTGLTADELAVCSRMGLTPEQFKAAKAEEQ